MILKAMKKLKTSAIGTVFLLSILISCTVFCMPRAYAADDMTLASADIVAAMTENIGAQGSGTESENELVRFQLYYGDLNGETKNFTLIKDNEGLGSAETYNEAGYTSTHINNNLIRVSKDFGLIFRLSAKQDIRVSFTNPAASADNAAYRAALTVIHKCDDVAVTVFNKPFIETAGVRTIPAGHLFNEVHMRAGDTVFYTVTTEAKGQSFSGMLPSFTLSSDGYNASLRFDFAAYILFKAEVETKKSELNAAYEAMDKTLYSMTSQLTLVDLLEKARDTLDAAEMGADLAALTTELLTGFDGVKTLAQEKTELDNLKKTRKTELNDYVGTLSKKNYSSDDWSKISERLETALSTIDGAKTTAAVNAAFNSAKLFIAGIETKESGCGSVAASGTSVAAVFLFVLVAVVIMKRKGKSNEII